MFKIDYWQIFVNTIKTAIAFWPLWVILLVIVVTRLFFYWLDLEIDNWHIRRKFKKGEKWRSDRDLLYWLRGMHPSEFEEYVADLFSKMGYKTKVTGGASYRVGILWFQIEATTKQFPEVQKVRFLPEEIFQP